MEEFGVWSFEVKKKNTTVVNHFVLHVKRSIRLKKIETDDQNLTLLKDKTYLYYRP